jgi:hypothetical protein
MVLGFKMCLYVGLRFPLAFQKDGSSAADSHDPSSSYGWLSCQEIFEFALAVVVILSGKELRICMEMADFGVSKRADLLYR